MRVSGVEGGSNTARCVQILLFFKRSQKFRISGRGVSSDFQTLAMNPKGFRG